MTWRRVGSILLGVITFASSWAMGMAVAEPPEPRLILSDVGAATASPIAIEKMYPGLAVVHPYVVGLTSTAPDAVLGLEITDLVDLERGCNHPETTSGDTTCDEFGGELSTQLLVSAALTATDDCDETTGSAPVVTAMPLTHVAAGGILDLAPVPSGEQRCLLLTFELPRASDNRTQTDLARFDLTIHAEQVIDEVVPPGGRVDEPERGPGNLTDATQPDDPTEDRPLTTRRTPEGPRATEPAVLGVSTERPVPMTQVLGVQLSATGTRVALLLALGLGGVAGGGLVLWLNRRRGRVRRPA